MPDPLREFLVLLEPRSADTTLAQLRAIANVTQVLAPRLALVRADSDTMARAAQIGGVLDVSDDTLPELPQESHAVGAFVRLRLGGTTATQDPAR